MEGIVHLLKIQLLIKIQSKMSGNNSKSWSKIIYTNVFVKEASIDFSLAQNKTRKLKIGEKNAGLKLKSQKHINVCEEAANFWMLCPWKSAYKNSNKNTNILWIRLIIRSTDTGLFFAL